MEKSGSPIPKRLIVLLVIAWILLVIGIAAPWSGSQARVWVPSAVNNYQLYGLETTKLMMIRNAAPTTPENFVYYSHHPPLIVWIPAALTQFLGFHEMGVRFAFASASLISVAAMYVVARRLYGKDIAWWATVFYATMPIISYFGHIPGFAQFALMTSLLFAAVLVNWLREPNRPRYLALMALAGLAVWMAWDAVFLVGALGCVAMVLADRRQRIGIIGLGVVTIVSLVVLLVSYQLQWSGAFDSLMDAFVWRSSNDSLHQGSASFNAYEFMAVNMLHIIYLATFPFVILSIWGIIPLRRRSNRFSTTILLGLVLGSVGYYLVFRNAAFVHHYYKATLMPAMSLTAAAIVVHERQFARLARRSRPFVDGLLLTTFISAAAMFYWIYELDQRPYLHNALAIIQEEATEDDLILFSRDDYNDSEVVSFYSTHQARDRISPESALRQAEETGKRVFYVYCGIDSHPVPDYLSTYRQEPLDELCVMIWIE